MPAPRKQRNSRSRKSAGAATGADDASATHADSKHADAKPADSKRTGSKGRGSKPSAAQHAAAKLDAVKQPAIATQDHGPAGSGNAAAPQAPAATPEPAPNPALIRVPLSVRWRDLDAFNHVNNSKFLSYLEEARLRWMVTLPGHGMDDHVAPVVAAAHLNYRRPIEWPNELDVELFVERLGTTSLSIGHRIVDANDSSALYCDGNVVLVWIHRETGQPAALPEPVRAACSAG
ncbi:acyl-CoA thioesterase [Lysobacter capsici]|nr:acyl-CoA thioesterase [Lysobacter capsici]